MNKIYFSKVFKGYKPEEVESFILKLNSDFQQKQRNFAAESKRLSSEIAQLKQSLEEKTAENNKLIAQNRELKNENQRLSTMENRQKEQPDNTISLSKEEEPSAGPEEAKPEDQNEYKKACAQIGERILIADKRAEEIVKEAKAEADRILAKAEESADEEIKRIIDKANGRIHAIYKTIAEFEKNQLCISAGLEQARKHITDTINEVEALKSSAKN